jgi:glyceraldehyde 3-phosphate dehydrogenase
MATRVAINGFGRVGRQALKAILQKYPDMEVVAINDVTTSEVNAHLFKYDSCYGIFDGTVLVEGDSLIINGKHIKVLAEKDPARLDWRALNIDVVLESSGHFTHRDKAKIHLERGAKKVVISAPATGEDLTIVLGVNQGLYDADKHHIISNASCTTNCLAPAAKVIHDNFVIENGFMTTVHSYTNDQRILDLPHTDLRRARAAAINIIPTSTGAAKALALVIPELKGKVDGFSLRVPTPTVSIVDFVANVARPVTREAVNAAFQGAAAGPLKGILMATNEQLVSTDFKGNSHSSCVDMPLTMVIGKMIKVVTWYDNEWAYSNRVVDLINFMFTKKLVAV